MIYRLQFTKQATDEITNLKKSDKLAFKKLSSLLSELINHPYSGTGKPERMKYNYQSYLSRRITKKHRLIYQIKDSEVIVLIISAMGHYDDK